MDQRPEVVTDEHLEFLDELRESGITNMYGATPYIEQKFRASRKDALVILGYWMESFGDEKR